MKRDHDATSRLLNALRRLVNSPEVFVFFFGFLLNFVWEMAQIPFFVGMMNARHWDAFLSCFQATLGDAGILLIAFLMTSMIVGDRYWVMLPRWGCPATFVGIALGLAVALELISVQILDRWKYSPAMPLLPVLQVGLTPVLQWILIPLVTIWLVSRQVK